jgi:hypothetical protein
MKFQAVRPSDLVVPHQLEAIKSHFVYDQYNRLIESYTAASDASHGARALKTSYQFVGNGSKPAGMKEELSTWDAAWDF